MLRKTVVGAAFFGAAAGSAFFGGMAEALAKPPAEWGGFGFGTVGGFIGNWANLEGDLNDVDALGPLFDLSPLTLHVGGGGRALLGQWVVLGGKGMAWFMGGDRRDDAEVTLKGAGGGFDIGIAAFNRNDTLVYPYIGIGAYALTLEVQNARDTAFSFGSARVAPCAADSFDAAFVAADFGLGIQRMMLFGERDAVHDGGMLVGFEAGLLAPFVRGTWSDQSGVELSGVQSFAVSGAYLRLTIGGGGFVFNDDPRYQRGGRDYEDVDRYFDPYLDDDL
jgi:hypothetical protein